MLDFQEEINDKQHQKNVEKNKYTLIKKKKKKNPCTSALWLLKKRLVAVSLLELIKMLQLAMDGSLKNSYLITSVYGVLG